MEYLYNNRRRNCLDKWSNHKLSRKGINVMILIIIFQYTVHFDVVQNAIHYYISHKGQGQSITSKSRYYSKYIWSLVVPGNATQICAAFKLSLCVSFLIIAIILSDSRFIILISNPDMQGQLLLL